MFGKAYLDHPDLSGQVPDTAREGAESIGEEVRNISELVTRALETATPISCKVNQQLLRQQLKVILPIQKQSVGKKLGQLGRI